MSKDDHLSLGQAYGDLAVTGVVYSWVTAAAMWQNFRARLPFLFDPTIGPLGRLQAHVARANPLWEQHRDGADVLVVFRGHEHYVSPNWYPSKPETHRVVPTWNYEAVHVHGRLTVHDDEKTVRGIVARLTNRHEAVEAVPWTMGSAPAAFEYNGIPTSTATSTP